jgi:hypothetical protein
MGLWIVHFKAAISAWAASDVGIATITTLVVGAIVAMALITAVGRDRVTWIALGKETITPGIYIGIYICVCLALVAVVLAAPYVSTIGSSIFAVVLTIFATGLAIVLTPFLAVWNWFTSQPLGMELLIIAIVMTLLIVAAIRKAADRIIVAMEIEADRRRQR